MHRRISKINAKVNLSEPFKMPRLPTTNEESEKNVDMDNENSTTSYKSTMSEAELEKWNMEFAIQDRAIDILLDSFANGEDTYLKKSTEEVKISYSPMSVGLSTQSKQLEKKDTFSEKKLPDALTTVASLVAPSAPKKSQNKKKKKVVAKKLILKKDTKEVSRSLDEAQTTEISPSSGRLLMRLRRESIENEEINSEALTRWQVVSPTQVIAEGKLPMSQIGNKEALQRTSPLRFSSGDDSSKELSILRGSKRTTGSRVFRATKKYLTDEWSV